MKLRPAAWTRHYADWIAALLIAIAFIAALTAANVVLPLILIAVAIALIVFSHKAAVQSFDFWAFDEWVRTRLNSFGVREWYSPYQAASHFCDPAVVNDRDHAMSQLNSMMMTFIRDQGSNSAQPSDTRRDFLPKPPVSTHADYDAIQARCNYYNELLGRHLHKQLVDGALIAKGLLVKDDMARAERVIPTSRWRVMTLDLVKANAAGHGWNYVGVVIAKKPSSST